MSRDIFHWTRVLRASSNLALSTAREGAATAPLGSVGQGLTTLRGKKFFLVSDRTSSAPVCARCPVTHCCVWILSE